MLTAPVGDDHLVTVAPRQARDPVGVRAGLEHDTDPGDLAQELVHRGVAGPHAAVEQDLARPARRAGRVALAIAEIDSHRDGRLPHGRSLLGLRARQTTGDPLTGILRQAGGRPSHPIYDDNGNLVDDDTYEYVYNWKNQLIELIDATSQATIATYTYDCYGLGRRVGKVVGSDTTRFVYADQQCIEEYDGSDDLLRIFAFGTGLDEVVMMEAPDVADVDDDQNTTELKRFYYHTQLVGSVTQVTDPDEVVVESYDYGPYGEIEMFDIGSGSISASAIGNPFTYTGRRLDEESGLYYYRARHYSPELKRFIQRDPLEYVDGPNAYGYVQARVTVLTDASGCDSPPLVFVGDDDDAETFGYVEETPEGNLAWVFHYDPNSETLDEAIARIRGYIVDRRIPGVPADTGGPASGGGSAGGGPTTPPGSGGGTSPTPPDDGKTLVSPGEGGIPVTVLPRGGGSQLRDHERGHADIYYATNELVSALLDPDFTDALCGNAVASQSALDRREAQNAAQQHYHDRPDGETNPPSPGDVDDAAAHGVRTGLKW